MTIQKTKIKSICFAEHNWSATKIIKPDKTETQRKLYTGYCKEDNGKKTLIGNDSTIFCDLLEEQIDKYLTVLDPLLQ